MVAADLAAKRGLTQSTWDGHIPAFSKGGRMRAYSVGRGRKKAVRKFTTHQGLSMAGMIGAAMLGMLLLWVFGVFRMD